MSALHRFSAWARDNRWVWSAIAVVIVWFILSLVTNRFSLSSLSGIILSASFLTLISLGQMFVVSTGRGNIDLSIPATLTLSAFVALLVIRGEDANLIVGLPAVVALHGTFDQGKDRVAGLVDNPDKAYLEVKPRGASYWLSRFYPPIFDLFRGDYGLGELMRAPKLDMADLYEHVAIEKETGFWRQFRLTPDDPKAFVAAVEKARKAR